jgi:hypothetical protein
MSTNGVEPTPPAPVPGRKAVVVVPTFHSGRGTNVAWALTAAVVSVVAHVLLIVLMLNINMASADTDNADDVQVETKVEDPAKEDTDLTNPDNGLDTSIPNMTNVERIEDITVPGQVDPTSAPGLENAPERPAENLPPPPGSGGGTGAAPLADDPGTGAMFGKVGGVGGELALTNAFNGRSGATRERMLQEGGGNAVSEAAVARGLHWLAMHQWQDGRWSLHDFHRHARDSVLPAGKIITCNCGGEGSAKNDTAGTAFGLLPFLASGITHRPPKEKEKPQVDYTKAVDGGLKYLLRVQGQDGYYGGDMYAHSLATIAVCEAYGLTSDPLLKGSAQRALNYLAEAQDPAGGGWRYGPKQAGDLSVTGWALMAMKSGQMAGLSVPRAQLIKVERFLDACESPNKGGYVYQPGKGVTASMTAVGLLCRLYLGTPPRNPNLIKGLEILKTADHAPGSQKGSLYYEYYATQVMHHVGGDSWQYWNKGPGGKNGIRDTLIAAQEVGKSGKTHEAGSWAPDKRAFEGAAGGRLMATSLSLLTLEVYYRHLPLYRRDMGGMAKDNK